MSRKVLIGVALVLMGTGSLPAQQSTSYRLDEHTINSGGGEANSTGFRMVPDAIGDPTLGSVSSTSFRVAGGFHAAFLPPGEARDLRFTSPEDLTWGAQAAAGVYNLYRGTLSSLSATDHGVCLQQDIPSNATTDLAVPAGNDGYAYLVTVENRLGLEGPLGSGRPNDGPCP